VKDTGRRTELAPRSLKFHFVGGVGIAVQRLTIGWGLLRRLVKFNLTTGAVSILGNVVAMRLLVGQVRVPYLLANGIAIALCSLLNLAVSECYVFRRQPANAGALAPFRLP
jgi:putative flippase GtrA